VKIAVTWSHLVRNDIRCYIETIGKEKKCHIDSNGSQPKKEIQRGNKNWPMLSNRYKKGKKEVMVTSLKCDKKNWDKVALLHYIQYRWSDR